MYFKFISRVALLFILIALTVSSLYPSAFGTPSIEAKTRSTGADSARVTEPLSRSVESPAMGKSASVVTWKGSQDQRWSNPGNWEGGRTPEASDIVRFDSRSGSEMVIGADSPGRLAGLVLEADYRGNVILKRDLVVNGDLILNGGTISTGNYSLNANSLRQMGGTFQGGGGKLRIRDEAAVTGGRLVTTKYMTVHSLTIESPGIVTMAHNSKLDLIGAGEPLKGGGLLDVLTNRPNSVEYTGSVTSDVTAARPVKGALGVTGPSKPEMISQLGGPERQTDSAAATASSFSRSGALTLISRERHQAAAVIDTASGFAYFGTFSSPGIIVKVRLSDFSRVGALVLNYGENEIRCATIDPAQGYAYFGTLSGDVVRVRLSDFSLAGSFNVGGPLAAAVIDPGSGFAYFGAYTGPGAVVKVRLSDFTPVDVLELNQGEDGILSAVIDTTNGFAYFGTGTSPGIVVKVRLSDFSRVSALTLNIGEDELTCAVIDPVGGYAYFGSFSNFFHVAKVRLSDMTRVGGLYLNMGWSFMRSAVIDAANDVAYFGTGNSPGIVVKVRLSDMSLIGHLMLNQSGESDLFSAVIDTGNGFIYFGTETTNIVKVRLSDFSRVGSLHLSAGENNLMSGVIDTEKGFAYFGMLGSPGVVVKVRLSDFTRVGILTLGAGENDLYSAVIDVAGGFAYFGTDYSGKIIKVRLSDFTEVGSLNAGASGLYSAVIDPMNGFAYFSSVTGDRGNIVKVRLSDFTRVGALTLNPGERGFCSVIDTTNGFAYFGTVYGDVVKVRLSDFTRVGALNVGAGNLNSAVIDPANGFAYFGSYNSTVTKVRLSDFTRVGTLDAGAGDLHSAVIDPINGFAYFGSYTAPGKVVKVRLSDLTRVDTLTLNVGEDKLHSAVIDVGEGFAYFGTATTPGKVIKINLPDTTMLSPTVQFSKATYSSGETDGHANITVTRTNTNAAASVEYATSDTSGGNSCDQLTGIASSHCDYTATTGTLQFAAGEGSKTIIVPIIKDNIFEGNENFTLTLSNPSGAILGSNSTAPVTIIDDDPQPSSLQLMLEESGTEPNRAAAIDATLFLRDPFPVVYAGNLLNQETDKNTRVIIFVMNLQLAQNEPSSSVIVHLTDSNGFNYEAEAEDVRLVPLFNFTQVRFRLPDNLTPGTYSIKVKAQSRESNPGTIRIKS